MNNDDLFNSIPEIGTRILFIFDKFKCIQEDKIVYLDYITLYANDFFADLKSINTKIPNYSTELITLYPRYREAIKYLIIKGFLNVKLKNGGYFYYPNKYVNEYIKLFDGEYIVNYQKNLQKVLLNYEKCSSKELLHVINEAKRKLGD